MSFILNIGMNHETAPVSLRECLAPEEGGDMVAEAFIRESEVVREALFLSTCNRVEALVVGEDPVSSEKAVIDVMTRFGKISQDEIAPFLYRFAGRDAVRHVFMVASSLDSMIVGEPQILGQMKQAYAGSVARKTSGVILNRLMHRAFHVAKRVRTETGICDAAVSVSYAAVEMAKKIFHSLQDKTVMLIGAGEMAELAARHLMGQGASPLVVVNRTYERALEVAGRFRAEAAGLEEIETLLIEADVVITSTASPGYVLTREQVGRCLKKRRNRLLFIVDIAVPRDVDPEVNRLENVYVYDIDDLRGVVQINVAQRRRESVRAEKIVVEEVLKFEKWIRTLHVVPTISALVEKAEAIVEAEMKRSRQSLRNLEPEQLEAVRMLVNSVSEKILSDPILFLKGKAESSMRDSYLDVTRRLFHLDEEISTGGRMTRRKAGQSDRDGENEKKEDLPWISRK